MTPRERANRERVESLIREAAQRAKQRALLTEGVDVELFDGDTYGKRVCARCGAALDGRRADARVCSSSCRGKQFRQRRWQRWDAERE